MDGGRPKPAARCETSPTSGAAPRPDGTQTRGGVPSDEREPLPTRIQDTPDSRTRMTGPSMTGSPRSVSSRRRGPGRHRRPPPPPPGLDRLDQPDRDPRPGRGRDGAHPRLPVRGPAAAGARRHGAARSRLRWRAVPGSRWRRPFPPTGPLVEPIGKKAGFLRDRRGGGRPDLGRRRRRSCGVARRRSPPPGRLAGRDRARGRLDVRARRALLPPAGAGRLVAWKRGDLSDRAGGGGAGDDGARRRPPCGAPGRLAGAARSRPGRRQRTGVVPPAYPRDPAARARRPW